MLQNEVMQLCETCKVDFPLTKKYYSYYYKGWNPNCRVCVKRKKLLYQLSYSIFKDYGITMEQYQTRLVLQGKCALCGIPFGSRVRHYLDHDHVTKELRAFLCILCNRALERLEKDPTWGERALAYLAKYKRITD